MQLKYSQFASLYAQWRDEHGLQRLSRAKRRSVSVTPLDLQVLKSWQRSHDRRKWEVSVALLGLSSGRSVSELCDKIGRARRTVEKWYRAYAHAGIDGFPWKRSRKLSEKAHEAIEEKRKRLIKIIHRHQTFTASTVHLGACKRCLMHTGKPMAKARRGVRSRSTLFQLAINSKKPRNL